MTDNEFKEHQDFLHKVKNMTSGEAYDLIKETQEEKLDEDLILEYGKISNGVYNFAIYGADRDNYTPHAHIYDGNDPNYSDTFSFEISLLDGNVLHVKNPPNAKEDWSSFSEAQEASIKRFGKESKTLPFILVS